MQELLLHSVHSVHSVQPIHSVQPVHSVHPVQPVEPIGSTDTILSCGLGSSRSKGTDLSAPIDKGIMTCLLARRIGYSARNDVIYEERGPNSCFTNKTQKSTSKPMWNNQ